MGSICDPIGGLVQIPCIERNTMGAMKAITASNLAMSSNPEDAIVKFDTVVKTKHFAKFRNSELATVSINLLKSKAIK